MKVAITGGTGFVGRHLARELVSQGHEVVLTSRGVNTSSSALLDDPAITLVKAGLGSAAELSEAFAGCEVVAHCAGVNRESGVQTFEVVHVEGTRNVLAACRQARVRKILLTSFLRARPKCGSLYHESKWAAEELVRASGLEYTVLKIGVIYGEGDQFLTHLRKVLSLVPFFGQVGLSSKTARPLAVEDLVKLMLAGLDDPRLKNVTVPVVGPEELSMRELVNRIGEQLKGQPLVIPIPVALHTAAAWLMEQTMKTPLLTTAQVTMLAEGLSEVAPECDELAEELRPQTPFSPSASGL